MIETNKLEELINSFVKPFKIWLAKTDSILALKTIYSPTVVMFVKENGRASFAETHLPNRAGLDQILTIIMTAKAWTFSSLAVYNGYKKFDNPYAGCLSIEEMCIKRDLLG